MGRIILCADQESLIRPTFIGLDECALDGRDWLACTANAAEARSLISQTGDVDEVWVAGSDDLVGVNIVAALRKDNPYLPVYLVMGDANGSEMSRAAQTGATATLSVQAFAQRFNMECQRRALAASVPDPAGAASLQAAAHAKQATQAPANTPAQASATAELAMPTPTAPRRDGSAFVISFLSGSGGVGKSTVAAISAYRAAAKGFRTVIVDCDLQFGDMHRIMAGAPGAKAADMATLTIDDVLAEPANLTLLEQQTPEGMPALVMAPSRIERSEDLSSHLGELMGICSETFEVVLVNTGANWTDSHAQLLEDSAASVFLIDQRASSVHACRHALDLCMRLGIASGPFVFALNRCKRGALFTPIDIANALSGAHVFEIKDGGAEVEEMLGAGLAAELAESKSEFCASIDAMLDELLPSRDVLATTRTGGTVSARIQMTHGSPRARRSRGSSRKAKARSGR